MIHYFIRAIIIVLCLTLIGIFSPYFPNFVFPIICLAYAGISMSGALYSLVIKRLGKQYILNGVGLLSRLNRKWAISVAMLLIAGIASSIIFILEAPEWSIIEWMIIWASIPCYYFLFKGFDFKLKEEFKPAFSKGRSIRASFWITTIVLSLVCSIFSSAFGTGNVISLMDAFENPDIPFIASSSALLSEADKVFVFTNTLTDYGLGLIPAQYIVLSIAFNFIINFSIFSGIVSLLSFCLLDVQEIKGEFQLLPQKDKLRSSGPILARYIVTGSLVSIAFISLYCYSEIKMSEYRESNEVTFVDQVLNEAQSKILIAVNAEDYLIHARNEELMPLIDSYYDTCSENIDSYIDWYESQNGLPESILRFLSTSIRNLTGFGQSDLDKFKELITADANGKEIEDIFKKYQENISWLAGKINMFTDSDSAIPDEDSIDGDSIDGDSVQQQDELDLWKPLNSEEEIVDLLNEVTAPGEDTDRERLRELIEDLISRAKSDTLEQLSQN